MPKQAPNSRDSGTATKHDRYPVKEFKTQAAYEKWLAANHAKAEGVWLKIAKAKTGVNTIKHLEALDVSLCYGWIDGLRRSLDEIYFLQKFTPRTATSIWSVVNKKKVAELIRSGKMQAAGLAAIEVAKKNGRWKNAYESQNTIKVPADLQQALDTNSKAAKFFAKLNSQNRYAILFRIANVKKAETRARKITEFVAMLENEKTIYPQKFA